MIRVNRTLVIFAHTPIIQQHCVRYATINVLRLPLKYLGHETAMISTAYGNLHMLQGREVVV